MMQGKVTGYCRKCKLLLSSSLAEFNDHYKVCNGNAQEKGVKVEAKPKILDQKSKLKQQQVVQPAIAIVFRFLGPRATIQAESVCKEWRCAAMSLVLWKFFYDSEPNVRLRPLLDNLIRDGVVDWRQAYCDSSRCLKCERDDALKVAYKTGEEADFCLNYYGNDRSWDDHGKEATRKEFDWDFMS